MKTQSRIAGSGTNRPLQTNNAAFSYKLGGQPKQQDQGFQFTNIEGSGGGSGLASEKQLSNRNRSAALSQALRNPRFNIRHPSF